MPKGSHPIGKAPILTPLLQQMVAALPEDLPEVRGKALLLVGFAGVFRQSELVSLQIRDNETSDTGLIVTLRHSKTAQEGARFTKGISVAAIDVDTTNIVTTVCMRGW